MVKRGVQPFLLEGDANPASVRVSNRALTNGALSSIITACALQPANTSGLTKYYGFKPAKVVVLIKGSQVDTKETSKITGIKYNPIDGNTFTLPFGRNTTTDTLAERRSAIITAAAANTNIALSFKTEDVADV